MAEHLAMAEHSATAEGEKCAYGPTLAEKHQMMLKIIRGWLI